MNNSKLFLSILCLFAFFQTQAQESVYLETVEHGRGLLKSRSGECFVITPAHVVNEAISKISVIGNKNVLSKGNLVQELSSDLAIVRIVDGGTQNCTTWSVTKNYSDILNSTVDAYLELRENNGGSKLMQVFITEKDEETITIVPKRNTNSFVKGMSGGALFTQYEGKKIFLGMLQQMGDDGEGYVYQADDMERILGGFFEENKSNPSNITMSTTGVGASAMSVEEEGYRFDLMSVKKSGTGVVCKFRVTSLEKDGQLYFRGTRNSTQNSNIYDQNGMKTLASNVKLGNQSNKYEVGGEYSLVKDIPVPLELTFKEVSSNALGISVLNLSVYNAENKSDFKIRFKNISFKSDNSKFEIPTFENVKYSEELDGYRFDLMSVKKSGTGVVCKFRVTSLEKDGQLYFRGTRNSTQNSNIYDQNGMKTLASNVKLGNQSNKYEVGGEYSLVKDIPVPLELTFKEVSSNALGISVLNLSVYNAENKSDFKIRFKNISFKSDNSKFEIPTFENVKYSEELDGYRFDLMSVKKSGTSVVCKFRVTSLEKDGQLYFRGTRNSTQNSNIYDQNGMKTLASNVKLGNQSSKYEVGEEYSLVKNIPVPLELTFKEVSSNALGISVLNLSVYNAENKSDFIIRFKNISFL